MDVFSTLARFMTPNTSKRYNRKIDIGYEPPLSEDPNAANISDLPIEVLERIFSHLPRMGEVGRLRFACRKFNAAGANVLRAKYRQLEVDLQHDIVTIRQRLADLLLVDPEGAGFGTPDPISRRRVAIKCVHSIETLAFCINQVIATIWSHNKYGICCVYDGDLLDDFSRAQVSILAAAERQTIGHSKRPRDFGVQKCREAAARFIWQFVYHVEQKTMTEGERRTSDVLSAVSLLNTLRNCKDSSSSVPTLTRYTNAAGEPTGRVHVSVVCTLNRCWMGKRTTAAFAAKPPEERVVPAMHALRELAWTSDGEYHLAEWQNLVIRAGIAPMTQPPPSAVVLLGDGVVRDVGSHGRWYEATDHDAERVYYYGQRSPARTVSDKFPTKLTRRYGRCLQIADKKVMIPTGYPNGVLDVKFEITCAETLLSEDLVQEARLVEDTLMIGGGWPSFTLTIESHSDASRVRTERWAFICHRGIVRRQSVGEGVVGVKRRRFEENRSEGPLRKRSKMD